jgi:hypothetical protein
MRGALELNIAGATASADFMINTDNFGSIVLTETTAPCFVADTKITTRRGKVAVQNLKIGDLVKSIHGDWNVIKWIGTRSYEGRFIAGNHLALPVCIKRHAIAKNIPSRDLFVSPDHTICEGVSSSPLGA